MEDLNSGCVYPLESVLTLVVEIGDLLITGSMPVKIKGKFGTNILMLAGSIEKPQVKASYYVEDGILYCEGDVTVENGILILPEGVTVENGILYLQ